MECPACGTPVGRAQRICDFCGEVLDTLAMQLAEKKQQQEHRAGSSLQEPEHQTNMQAVPPAPSIPAASPDSPLSRLAQATNREASIETVPEPAAEFASNLNHPVNAVSTHYPVDSTGRVDNENDVIETLYSGTAPHGPMQTNSTEFAEAVSHTEVLSSPHLPSPPEYAEDPPARPAEASSGSIDLKYYSKHRQVQWHQPSTVDTPTAAVETYSQQSEVFPSGLSVPESAWEPAAQIAEPSMLTPSLAPEATTVDPTPPSIDSPALPPPPEPPYQPLPEALDHEENAGIDEATHETDADPDTVRVPYTEEELSQVLGKKQPWYFSTPVVVLSAIFCCGIGLGLCWLAPYSKRKKIIITLVVVAIWLASAIVPTLLSLFLAPAVG